MPVRRTICYFPTEEDVQVPTLDVNEMLNALPAWD